MVRCGAGLGGRIRVISDARVPGDRGARCARRCGPGMDAFAPLHSPARHRGRKERQDLHGAGLGAFSVGVVLWRWHTLTRTSGRLERSSRAGQARERAISSWPVWVDTRSSGTPRGLHRLVRRDLGPPRTCDTLSMTAGGLPAGLGHGIPATQGSSSRARAHANLPPRGTPSTFRSSRMWPSAPVPTKRGRHVRRTRPTPRVTR